MRRLVLLAAAATLMATLAACDVYPKDNSLGHCDQARRWPDNGTQVLGAYSLLNWSRVEFGDDALYKCRGHDYRIGHTICWTTTFISGTNPPHQPELSTTCPVPT